MSLSGGVERRITLLDVLFKRHLSEQEVKLLPGWSLRVTVGPIEMCLDDLGWHKWRWDIGPGFALWACGFVFEIAPSGETFERIYVGDAEALDPRR
jgi:hypothetical protein